jgi:uncharacterized protein
VVLLVVGVCLIGLGVTARWRSLRSFERKTLNPGVLSEATPADVGLAFERTWIPSEDRRLGAFLVRAAAGCARSAALLIFHGRHETVADWIKVQGTLSRGCVSSLVFDYSGHGHSSPPGTIAHLNADAVAAYRAFLDSFPSGRRCVLSHSLGAGPLLYAVTHVTQQPDCVILASSYSSFRELAVQGGLPRPLRFILPDVWDNVEAAARVRAPLLWLHSRADATIPIALGQPVYASYGGPKSALALDGFDHNAIYQRLPAEIWSPVLSFATGDHRTPP